MRQLLLIVLFLIPLLSYGQGTSIDFNAIDEKKLNEFILVEVNKLRKKKKLTPFNNEVALLAPAQDHANYMAAKNKLTHKQREKVKRTPKNRVDFYGELFDIVGENVQYTTLHQPEKLNKEKKATPIDSYERLAKLLVQRWKDSPPHYKNMMEDDYKSTYVAVKMSDKGLFYACQLFGGTPYEKPKEQVEFPSYKPYNNKKCWRCDFGASPIVQVDENRNIYMYMKRRRVLSGFNLLGMYKRRSDGYAADIVLKEQYTCGKPNHFNGNAAADGIALPPVYKKDFRKGNNKYNIFFASVYLGKVPDWVEGEYEVNLTTVINKRPCSLTMFHEIPLQFDLTLEIPLKLDTLSLVQKEVKRRESFSRINFEKSIASADGDEMKELIADLEQRKAIIVTAEVKGFSSIEGTKEGNEILYQNRAQLIVAALEQFGIDAAKTAISTKENYSEFRTDIIGTKFEHWKTLTDEELKDTVNFYASDSTLEAILKMHRYATLKLNYEYTQEINYSPEKMEQMFKEAISSIDIKKGKKAQSLQYNMAVNGEVSLQQIKDLPIPFEQAFLPLLLNREIMLYTLDSADNPNALRVLEANFKRLFTLDENNEAINTALMILLDRKWFPSVFRKKNNEYMDMVRKNKTIASDIQAKILFRTAMVNDISLLFEGKSPRKSAPFFYNTVSKEVKNAQFTVEELFDISRYYYFMNEPKFALELIRKKVDEATSVADIVYFLKLIYLTGESIPHKQLLKYFNKVKELTGPEFCTFFNSPNLNFQIFKDLDLKDIYCEECSEKSNE